MAKVVRCRDVGFDCDGVVRAETEEDALPRSYTTLKRFQVVKKVRQVMSDE